MKIFISWSGKAAGEIGSILSEYMSLLIPGVETFLSAEDIEKGTRWSSEIAQKLEDSDFGLIVLTKENIKAPWLHFEAGALSKSIADSKVSPILFGTDTQDIAGTPLSQFQATYFSKIEFKKLVLEFSKNFRSEGVENSKTYFEKFWDEIQSKVDLALNYQVDHSDKNVDSTDLVLREIMQYQRHTLNILRNPNNLLSEQFLTKAMVRVADVPALTKNMYAHIEECEDIIEQVEAQSWGFDDEDAEEMSGNLNDVAAICSGFAKFSEKIE